MQTNPSIKSLLEFATHTLDTGSARLDAEVMLAACLDKPRSHLHAWPERSVKTDQQTRFLAWLQRRAAGEPVAHLTGRREFWSLELLVTPDTLIPRPETETLVALALEKIPEETAVCIADLGTGSGAIALAIARERPHAEILATDISARALDIARQNARRLEIENVQFVEGPWCAALPARPLDFILSNPPYIADSDPHLEEGDVRYEPRSALAAGPRGLDDLQLLVRCAAGHLADNGWLIVEHGYDQDSHVRQLFRESGYRAISDHADDAGINRVTMGKRDPAIS
ncbi:MAG: peptide chain release factor N(5)-glutamine methyltransferase [Gammaproteobacteria bacterium]|nr:MAG: peptide chain release factor N(5)-glutamine methyltransferase [Gammaproteobacteria bacterium]